MYLGHVNFLNIPDETTTCTNKARTSDDGKKLCNDSKQGRKKLNNGSACQIGSASQIGNYQDIK